jgi:pyruvate/2-oxoglutarate dehydrogenase complex dihydrolipoamide dehydrogenase (E3) component
MGTLVARNLVNKTMAYMGTQGTSGIKIYNWNISSTGLTVEAAMANDFDVSFVTAVDNYRPEFMPTSEEVRLKLVFEKETRRVLGAQIISEVDLTQTMNTLSVCIQNQMTVDEIAFVDFFFQPHFNKPWNIINLAGQMALDL